MYNFICQFVVSTKYLSILLLTFVLPTETVMPVVGYMASLGHMSLPLAVSVGVAGTTLWAAFIYALVRSSDQKVVYAAIDKYGRWIGLSRKNVESAGMWFDRHNRTAVLLTRFVPGLRTATCIPAGFRHMSFGVFVLSAAVGSLVDCAVLAYLGYTAHMHLHELRVAINDVSNLIILGLLVALLAWILWRRRRKV